MTRYHFFGADGGNVYARIVNIPAGAQVRVRERFEQFTEAYVRYGANYIAVHPLRVMADNTLEIAFDVVLERNSKGPALKPFTDEGRIRVDERTTVAEHLMILQRIRDGFEREAERLHEQHDYGAEFPAGDAMSVQWAINRIFGEAE